MENKQGIPMEPEEGREVDPSIPEDAFLIIEGTDAVRLNLPIVKIGRGHDNTVVIDDPRVSRHHMELRAIHGNFVLFDVGSSGGTYINGQRTAQAILYPGDVISLAGVGLLFTQGLNPPLSDGKGPTSPFVGPGQRGTAIFNTSFFSKKKK